MSHTKITLSTTDRIFIKFVLRQYAKQTGGLDSEDRENILDIASKFD